MEKQERKKMLEQIVQDNLPQFVKSLEEDAEVVIFHQDAFGADYQMFELLLLGCAIKLAGEKGKEVRIIGKNRETLNK